MLSKQPAAEIPIPGCKIVPDYETNANNFNRPKKYIIAGMCRLKTTELQSTNFLVDENPETIEYDMDDEDEEFLAELNKGEFRLSEDRFEQIVAQFELEASQMVN